MKSSRLTRPTIRRMMAVSVSSGPSPRQPKFSSSQVVTMVVSVGSLLFSGASALFTWKQADAAGQAPIAQAVAIQRVQGCGQLVRAFNNAQGAIVVTIADYGDGSRIMPNEDVIKVVRSIQAANEAAEANLPFFDLEERSIIQNAAAAVFNLPLIRNLADDGRLQGLGPGLDGWFQQHTSEPVSVWEPCAG